MKKALEENPDAFEYDSVYDTMKAVSDAPKSQKSKEPKYMNTLLKTAEFRKKEKDRAEERKIQKEREAEGEQFEDKEAFVTSAYKEKLKELRETEEREKREKQCEDLLDVKKQGDLSGFYRHLLRQEVGEEKVSESGIRDFGIGSSAPQAATSSSAGQQATFSKSQKKRSQNLRARNEEESDEEEVPEPTLTETDAIVSGTVKEEPLEQKVDAKKESEPVAKAEIKEEPEIKEPPKPKVDRKVLIQLKFTKRTIGEAFEAARERFLERKRLRAG